jgi:hypothetical protein
VALGKQGDLYVTDQFNNRLLEYEFPMTTDRTADRVFGQPGFTSSTINNGVLSAHSLNFPTGVALDAQSAQGNIYVGDGRNNRALEYDWAVVKLWLPLVVR